MAKETYESVLKKLNDLGDGALTQDEKNILKYGAPEKEKMVNSDDYSELQAKDMKKRQDKGEKLDDVEATVLRGKRLDDSNEAVEDVVIAGHNDVWRKTYNYKEDGGLEFTVAIRMPTIVEEGRIKAKVQNYFVGTAGYYNDYWNGVYEALSDIRVCGVDVPKVFADDDKIYAVTADWLYNVWVDFEEWKARFLY